ncbi:heme o synthase [Pseudohoeflea coraliihabitans]|uniref:Protoheme IX farnesyltransferase n=1 Tax=Pseudohoeflea coraliihabitans TaxID=2860393 RepID=A0ABS6WLT7_9HYPH|nr:heme o synthase [Pseudohoeflea sp. DP4N28-3]MBW3096937.1 heme o synthase [Pseudohoeflea sp. DP4N28-3]
MTGAASDKALPIDGASLLSEGDAGDFFALLKPRVMSLVVFTALVGMLVAPGGIHPVLGFIAVLCIALGGGASGALNMWYEADIDAVMQRTRNRPIPAGRIAPSAALGFGIVLAAFSVALLGLVTNWLAAGLLAFTIFFYAVVYTIWLKRSTPQNIVIGGAAGAFPPMIGWAAVTGTLSLESLILFAIIFLWTPAHFWALALFKSGDYGKAGIPMMPNVAGDASTKRQIVVYAVLTAVAGVLPTLAGFASLAYGAVAAALGIGFVWYALTVLAMPSGDEQMRPAKKLFAYSLLYLALIFAALLADSLIARFTVWGA